MTLKVLAKVWEQGGLSYLCSTLDTHTDTDRAPCPQSISSQALGTAPYSNSDSGHMV